MEFLTTLWMPIVVSAVVVFVASFLLHMVIPIHKGDFKKLPDEDKVMDVLRDVAPHSYMMPGCENSQEMRSPEFDAKCDKGPNGLVIVWPGKTNMGQNLMATLLYYIVVGVFVAYIGWHAMHSETTDYLTRFRICGASAFLAHALGWMPFSIWYKVGKFWPNFVDGVVYSLLTAGIFASMWK